MQIKLSMSALCAVLALSLAGMAYAQTWNLPDSRRNTRFTTDLHDIVRPALTIRGFDNTNLPTQFDTVYYIHLNNETVITPKNAARSLTSFEMTKCAILDRVSFLAISLSY